MKYQAAVMIAFVFLLCSCNNADKVRKSASNAAHQSSTNFSGLDLSSEGKKIADNCSTQISKTRVSDWYDCIHRVCIADMVKSNARRDATQAFQAGDRRLFAAMGYEDMHLTTTGITVCVDLKPSFSRGTLEEKYPVTGGGDGALSRGCTRAELGYMSEYNKQIISTLSAKDRRSLCLPTAFFPDKQ